MFRLPLLLALLTAPVWADEPKPVTVTLRMLDGLRFDPPRFEAPPGAKVTLKLENADTTHQIHNVLIVNPGRREAVVQAALELGDQGLARAFVPDSPEVIAASALLQPEQSGSLSFTLPTQKGVYPFVCTFPGHGFVMYGAIYAGVKMPTLAKDPHLPPVAAGAAVPGGGRRPFVQRMFLPDAGPAAMAVALPGDWNLAWDAGPCRLRYTWQGDFLDCSKYWASNGNHRGEPLGLVRWRAAANHAPWSAAPAFRGYRPTPAGPVFQYSVEGVAVEESFSVGADGALRVRYASPGSTARPLRCRGPGAGAELEGAAAPPEGALLVPGGSLTYRLPTEIVP
jgi:azurin